MLGRVFQLGGGEEFLGFFSLSFAESQRQLRIFGSGLAAIFRISSILAGFNASGRQMSVTIERPQHAHAAVDGHDHLRYGGHTDHIGADVKKRYSARVSRFGPVTAA